MYICINALAGCILNHLLSSCPSYICLDTDATSLPLWGTQAGLEGNVKAVATVNTTSLIRYKSAQLLNSGAQTEHIFEGTCLMVQVPKSCQVMRCNILAALEPLILALNGVFLLAYHNEHQEHCSKPLT